MQNQFFYKRVEIKQDKDGKEVNTEFIDSFSLDMIIRTLEMEDGKRLILLKDIHERLEKVPQFNTKKNVIVKYTKERNTFQSEIYLLPEDNKKFLELLDK